MKRYLPNANLLFRLFMVLSFTTCFVLAGQAQKRNLQGYVLDSINYSPLLKAHIVNTRTNKTAEVGAKGSFSIFVAPNDIIFFTADNYHFKQVKYTTLVPDTFFVYLAPLPHELAAVVVSAVGYTRYQQDSMKRRRDFLQDMGTPKAPAATNANSGAGIGINLNYFSKDEKRKRRAYELEAQHEKDAYVKYRFSEEIVTYYTGFTGDTLKKFMLQYTPDYNWLRTHTGDEDILYYINDKMRVFLGKKN